MHEISIAGDLAQIVLKAAGDEHLEKVSRVSICFGALIQIVPDIFEFAFRECVRHTIADEAELSIEIVPVKMQCVTCGKNFKVKENLFRCSGCGSADLKIVQGKELFIKSMEGE